MPRVLLNGEPQFAENCPDRWGDLLASIELAAAEHGELLTDVRFDGVDEPTFRDPSWSDWRVTDLHEIDVRTATLTVVANEALRQAAIAADALADAAAEIARATRTADPRAAGIRISELGHGFGALLSVFELMARVRAGILEQQDNAGITLSARFDELVAHYEALVTAQQSGDWTAAAGVLEKRLQPVLRACAAVCRTGIAEPHDNVTWGNNAA